MYLIPLVVLAQPRQQLIPRLAREFRLLVPAQVLLVLWGILLLVIVALVLRRLLHADAEVVQLLNVVILHFLMLAEMLVSVTVFVVEALVQREE